MASFRTAYLQRALAIDCAVKATVQTDTADNTALGKAFGVRQTTPASTAAIKVGDLIKLTPATATLPASIERVLSLAAATHIMAQSDNTMEYGNIPVENRDYRYFPMVNGTYTTTLAADTPVKKVNLYRIVDKEDVEIDISQGETA